MKVTLCYEDENGLRTYSLFLLGMYAEIWCWPDGIEVSVGGLRLDEDLSPRGKK